MKAARTLAWAGSLMAAGTISAQVAFDGDYSQDFDGLANTGTANTWTDNSTLPGWYSSRATYRSGTGSLATGDLYSFGSSESSDRALGSVASNSTGTIGFGLRLQNSAGLTLEQINISYTGEQWRNGGNTTAQSITFWYQTGINLSSVDLQNDAGWTAVSSLDFTGPIAISPASALDGNLSANRTAISQPLVGVTLAPGQELFLRWKDNNDLGSDHGLAIDNLNVTALTVVPEPSTWALLGGGLLFMASRLRRKR